MWCVEILYLVVVEYDVSEGLGRDLVHADVGPGPLGQVPAPWTRRPGGAPGSTPQETVQLPRREVVHKRL